MTNRFALVVGHELKSPGAWGTAPLNCYEYEYNKTLAAIVSCCLMDHEITSEVFFRDNVGIAGAYAEVNLYDPVGVVELHFNSTVLHTACGTETLYVPRVSGSDRLANLVHSSICVSLDRKGALNRGVKVVGSLERGHINLTSAKCPSILIEPFFGDNKKEAQLAIDKKPHLAFGIAQGIIAFIGMTNALH